MALTSLGNQQFPINTVINEFKENVVQTTVQESPITSISTGGGVLTAADTLPHNPSIYKPGHIVTGTDKTLRHFTFILSNSLGGGNAVTSLQLNINPEDMSVDNPYRVNAVQTMGGAFVDVWGDGIRRLIIRGHTGWRTHNTTVQRQDGFDNIFTLRDNIINKYFEIRLQSSNSFSQEEIESKLKLTLVDELHNTAYVIVPEVFRLLRNKARPLLHMYEAAFIVQNNKPPKELTSALDLLRGKDDISIAKEMDRLGDRFSAIKDQLASIHRPFKDALGKLVDTGTGLTSMFSSILQAKQKFTQGIDGIRSIAQQATQAIHSAIGTIQSFADLSPVVSDVKLMIYEVKSIYKDLECLLNQVKHGGLYVYTGIVGSTACAALYGAPTSTLAGTVNSFDVLTQAEQKTSIGQAASSITAKAQVAIDVVDQFDTPAILAGRA
jgi:hypothetical protein